LGVCANAAALSNNAAAKPNDEIVFMGQSCMQCGWILPGVSLDHDTRYLALHRAVPYGQRTSHCKRQTPYDKHPLCRRATPA